MENLMKNGKCNFDFRFPHRNKNLKRAVHTLRHMVIIEFYLFSCQPARVAKAFLTMKLIQARHANQLSLFVPLCHTRSRNMRTNPLMHHYIELYLNIILWKFLHV